MRCSGCHIEQRGEDIVKKIRKCIIVCVILAVFAVFCFWQNNMLTVSQYEYENEKISAELDGFKIVQISDLHNKQFGAEQKRLLERVSECSPDIIVITGDIVDSNHTDIGKALAFVEGAAEIAPVYYVTGNHELWLEDGELEELLDGISAAGAVILDDECVTVTSGDSSFILAGLDDSSLYNDTIKELELDNSRETVILLAHEPQYLSDYSRENVDLILAGHAHGGQFRLPFIGGIVAPDQGFFPEYTAGVYTENETEMIVSRGLGNSVIPLRLFNFPDIVCVTLKDE